MYLSDIYLQTKIAEKLIKEDHLQSNSVTPQVVNYVGEFIEDFERRIDQLPVEDQAAAFELLYVTAKRKYFSTKKTS